MQLLNSRRVSRRSILIRRFSVVLLAVLGLGAWLAYEPAKMQYKIWKQKRALGQAREFVAKRDLPKAQMALDVALTAVPGNVDALRAAAEMLEQAGAPQAMRLRRSVVRVLPESADDAAMLVFSCLRFRDLNAAKDAVSAFPVAFADKLPTLRAALALAVATQDTPVIDFIYGQLKERIPNDQDIKISQALLHLRHPMESKRIAARQELEAVAKSNPKIAPGIHREFLGFALAARDYAEARKWLTLVIAAPGVQFNDHLQLANLELLVDKKPFEPIFAQLAPLAGKNEAEAVQFMQWLLVQDRVSEADRWQATLPAAIRDSKALAVVQTDIAARLKDWDRFSALVIQGTWGPITKETLRLAEAAQAISGQDNPTLRRETWDLALQSSRGNLGALVVLYRMASTWRWSTEVERTLWSIVRRFPDQPWAHQTLFEAYAAKRDANGMRDVMNSLRTADPFLLRYQNDWALLSMLTDPTSGITPAKETIKKLYNSDPKRPNYITGYAFALAQMGKGAEALTLVQALPPVDRDYQPRQPYLAYICGVARDAPGLERAIAVAKDYRYLPDETRLFERGREELTRKPPVAPVKKAPPAKK